MNTNVMTPSPSLSTLVGAFAIKESTKPHFYYCPGVSSQTNRPFHFRQCKATANTSVSNKMGSNKPRTWLAGITTASIGAAKAPNMPPSLPLDRLIKNVIKMTMLKTTVEFAGYL